MAGYLFVHFTGEHENGEQVYFSLSKDGLHFTDLNEGNPVLISELGEKGIRDPFLIKDKENETYYLIATDLRIGAGKGWGAAQYQGSKNLIIWESKDLINWSKERSVKIGVDGAGCVWAPEAIFDREKKAFLVFYASMIALPGDKEAKQRIYGTYTKDFLNFTPPFVYIERENHVIDTTIAWDGEAYYRISKDETTKKLIMESNKTLDKEGFTMITSDTLEELYGVEGPELYELTDGTWCLIADRFAEGKGYLPMIIKDLNQGDFRILEDEEYDLGKNQKRHGGVLRITDEEYEHLLKNHHNIKKNSK